MFSIDAQIHPRHQRHCLDRGLVGVGGAFVQTFYAVQTALAAGLAQLLGRGWPGTDLKKGCAGAGHCAAAEAPEHHIAGTGLFAQSLEHHWCVFVTHPAELHGTSTGLLGRIVSKRVERGLRQVQSGHQCTFNLDVKPALDRARDKLVRDEVDHPPRQYAHQGKNGGQLDQQARAELPTSPAQQQTQTAPDNRDQKGDSHHAVDQNQPLVVQPVLGTVAGRLGQQHQQHHAEQAEQDNTQVDQHPRQARCGQCGCGGVSRGHGQKGVTWPQESGVAGSSRNLRPTARFQSACAPAPN